MHQLEPLLFEPLFKARTWGGDLLRRFGKRVPVGSRIGESWEVADLPRSIPEGRSRVACGPYAGKTLNEVLAERPVEIMGLASLGPDGRFPLLVKFLDAAQHLSVQVHPDAAYARTHPDAHMKTEAWVVISAQPGAVLFRGVRPSVDRERFFDDLRSGQVVQHLVAVSVDVGDCIYLPSGICHALGAGVLVAEVQTPSDTTFRLFDWNRNDPHRPLHIEQARQCMRFGSDQEDGCPGIVRRQTALAMEAIGITTRSLARTKYFTIESLECRAGTELPVVTNESPIIWTITEGEADFAGPRGQALRLRRGDTALIPARLEGWNARFPGVTSVIRTSLPTRLDSALA